MTKDNLGNPMAIVAAGEMLQNPTVQKGIAKGFTVLGLAGFGYFGFRFIKKKHQQALMNRAGSDPVIKAAVDIYNAIPDGLKKGQGSIWNPIGFIKDLGNEISNLWTSADTDNLYKVAKNIYANRLSIHKVYSRFHTLYGEALYPLLQSALKTKELNRFTNLCNNGNISTSKPLQKSAYAVVNVNSGVTIREKPDVPNWAAQRFGVNKYGVVPFGMTAGIATGKEYYNKDDDTVFSELLIYDKERKIHKAWAWKGAFRFTSDRSNAGKMFYFSKGEFNGLQGNEKNVEFEYIS